MQSVFQSKFGRKNYDTKFWKKLDGEMQAYVRNKEIHDNLLVEKGLELFILPEPDMPDHFMAVKPWKGAIKAPSNPPEVNES